MSGLFDMINAQSKVVKRHVKVMLRDVVSDALGKDSILRIFSIFQWFCEYWVSNINWKGECDHLMQHIISYQIPGFGVLMQHSQ